MSAPESAHNSVVLSDETVPLANYSAALDEVYALRSICAYVARVVEAHTGIKAISKGSREILDRAAIEALREAARGHAEFQRIKAGTDSVRRELEKVTGTGLMTRYQWEEQQLP